MKLTSFSLIALLASAAVPSAGAAVVILNPGFELPAHTANNGTNPDDWTVIETTTGTNPDRQVRTRNNNERSGAMSVQLNAGQSDPDGQLWQAVTTSSGQQYTFSIWGRALNTAATLNFKVELRDGSGTGGAVLGTFDSAGGLTSAYTEYTVDFTALSTDTTIHISDTSSATSGNDVYLDDVSMSEIPEPGAASLALLGGLAFALRRRRK